MVTKTIAIAPRYPMLPCSAFLRIRRFQRPHQASQTCRQRHTLGLHLFVVNVRTDCPAPNRPTRHIHHKADSIGSGHAAEDHDYLHAVAESFANAGAVLITGPANAKIKLVKHIHHHDPRLMNVIAGVETVDHPNDAELVAYARKYLKATDLRQPQR
jgi:hypothetical protein